jgi:hypothetical protein
MNWGLLVISCGEEIKVKGPSTSPHTSLVPFTTSFVPLLGVIPAPSSRGRDGEAWGGAGPAPDQARVSWEAELKLGQNCPNSAVGGA